MKKKFIFIIVAVLFSHSFFLNPVFALPLIAPIDPILLAPTKLVKDAADKAAAEKAKADDISIKNTLNFYTGTFKNPDKKGGVSKFSINNVANSLIPAVATWITGFLGALAVLSLFYAGFEFLTAGGDAEKVSHAAKTAYYVVLGLVLMMFAYALVYLFLTIFSG